MQSSQASLDRRIEEELRQKMLLKKKEDKTEKMEEGNKGALDKLNLDNNLNQDRGNAGSGS